MLLDDNIEMASEIDRARLIEAEWQIPEGEEDGGKYFADITVKNAETDAVVVVALYNGDEMTGVALSKNAE